MPGRWRGRSIGLAIVALLTAALTTAALAVSPPAADHAPPASAWRLVISDGDGAVLATAVLPERVFTLRYRNSVYRSLAEERFTITDDGRMLLAGLAADEAAVLDEYYEAGRPQRAVPSDPRRWRAEPGGEVLLEEIALAATPTGRRTLLVDGHPPIALWRLVEDGDPGLTLRAEPVP